MTIGRIVDFVIAYNERQEQAEEHRPDPDRKQEKRKPDRIRKATQADINAYFG